MTDAACLGRSFSSPSTSREAKEGNPLRALGESVSFGRFLSDSLAWEKWSVFSHNRYREEAEKISKPGSVAQLKTFFEAHYKKTAEERRAAAALLETAKAVSTNAADSVTENLVEQKEQKEDVPNRKKAEDVPPKNKKVVEDLVDKKSAKSLHMSVHFSSHALESNKRTPPVVQRIRNSNKISSFNMPKNNSSSSQTRASVNGILKTSVNLKSENRSTKPHLNKSVAGGITADRKWNRPLTDNLKSSCGKGSKPRSPTISFPFSFRSEERAVKRKEFFQKLEDKRNAEAEMNHPQTRYQEKPMQGVKKVRQSTSLKPKSNEDLRTGSQLPSTHMKKIPVARPRSPMLGRTATHSKIPDANSLLSTNAESSKRIENNQSTNRSASSRHNNASPNIQSPMLGRKATRSKIPDANSQLSTNTESSKCIENNRSTNRSASSRHENASPNIQSPALKR
ncbi:hypothetical protein UlMin_040093 [Ulmus minor]